MSGRLHALGMDRNLLGLKYAEGDEVQVLAFQRWRVGRVLRLGTKRLFVEYLTPKGAKTRREAWFSIDRVRRA